MSDYNIHYIWEEHGSSVPTLENGFSTMITYTNSVIHSMLPFPIAISGNK